MARQPFFFPHIAPHHHSAPPQTIASLLRVISDYLPAYHVSATNTHGVILDPPAVPLPTTASCFHVINDPVTPFYLVQPILSAPDHLL